MGDKVARFLLTMRGDNNQVLFFRLDHFDLSEWSPTSIKRVIGLTRIT